MKTTRIVNVRTKKEKQMTKKICLDLTLKHRAVILINLKRGE